ncbi:MAG: hypothetical protein ABL974_21545 [Prosthecobacter sp.]
MADPPEQQARQNTDAMLAAAGWAVQDYTRSSIKTAALGRRINFSAICAEAAGRT